MLNWHINIPTKYFVKRKKPFAAQNIQWVQGGEPYFALLEQLINNAQREIHLHTYIFENDPTGKRITNALVQAAKRKVTVFVLLDAYGSKGLGGLENEMRQAGIHIRFYGNIYTGKNWAWGRRLHHKIVVADRCIALVGGINIANHYSGMDGKQPWLDFAMQAEGEAVKEIAKICTQLYTQKYITKKNIYAFTKFNSKAHTIPLYLLQNDWLRGKNQIARAYTRAIKQAKKEIIIVNSYFLPGSKFCKELKKAALRGVLVKIVVPGISDVPFVHSAMRYLYARLLRNGVEIYEWKKSILHAKVACIDEEWVTIGSYNLNFLSAYGSIEFNLCTNHLAFGKNFATHLNTHLFVQSHQVEAKTYLTKQNIWKRFVCWFSYKLIRFSEALLITFPGQKFFTFNKYA